MSHWLETSPVPLFVSHRRLARNVSVPRANIEWALDSGGFTELKMYGEWRTTPEEYVAAVRRYDREIGRLEWAATQDWMCEPFMLAKTGLTVEAHQLATVRNFVQLQALWYRETDDESPFMPPVQGWAAEDYARCADLYTEHGVDIREFELVGVGSVCRRQHTAEIGDILETLRGHVDPELPTHLFGAKTLGLRRYGHMTTTADSLAWSLDAYYLGRQGCDTEHPRAAVTCANCLPYALRWRESVLDLPVTHYETFGCRTY
jgi:hypothetical protein